MAVKICTKCKVEKEFSEFSNDKYRTDGYTYQCKACRNKTFKIYRDNNREKIKKYNQTKQKKRKEYYKSEEGILSSRRSHLKRRFNISLEDYNTILQKQNGQCAICGTKYMDGRYEVLAVDHDHKTGKIRGLLCGNCNLGLGNLKDDINLLEKALTYLKTHSYENK